MWHAANGIHEVACFSSEGRCGLLPRLNSGGNRVRVARTAWPTTMIARSFRPPWFWLALVALMGVLAFCYLPPSSIAMSSWDFYDSLMPLQELRPAPWTTLFDLDAIAERALNGQRFNFMGISELSVYTWLYWLLPSFWDVAAHLILSRLLIFTLSHAIATRFLQPTTQLEQAIAAVSAFHLALMPLHPYMLGPTIALCMLTYGTLRILDAPNDRLAIGFFVVAPFFDMTVLGGLFFYPVLFAIAALSWSKPHFRRLAGATAASFGLSLVVDYRLFTEALLAKQTTQRSLWLANRRFAPFERLLDPAYWERFVNELSNVLVHSQSHYYWTGDRAKFAVLATSLLLLTGVFLRRRQAHRRARGLTGLDVSRTGKKIAPQQTQPWWPAAAHVLALRVGAVSAAFLTVCITSSFVRANFVDIGALIGSPVQLDRVVVMAPLLTVLLLAGGLGLWARTLPRKASALVLVALAFVCFESVRTCQGFGARAQNVRVGEQRTQRPGAGGRQTIASYFARGLFDAIKAQLGPTWRDENVISVGFDPMIASFHGFRHLDGYFQMYSLAHKRAFRRVIAAELDKNPEKRRYFDDWGSRIYVFVSDTPTAERVALHVDACALRDLKGTLVISQFELTNSRDIGLISVGRAQSPTGWHRVAHLYRPDETRCATGAYGRSAPTSNTAVATLPPS